MIRDIAVDSHHTNFSILPAPMIGTNASAHKLHSINHNYRLNGSLPIVTRQSMIMRECVVKTKSL